LGRLDEAVDLGRRVVERDPLSAAYWHNLGLTCHAAGLLDESEKAFRRALELAPKRLVSGALLALVFIDEGRIDDAIEAAKSEADEFWRTWAIAIINHIGEHPAEAIDALDKLVKENSDGNAYQIAEVYAIRGEIGRAFEWIEQAVSERDPGVTHTKV